MARYRTIKPEFWSSEQIMECSLTTRLLFIGLWNFCDDAGRHPFAPKQIKALVFPGDDLSVENVRGMLDELSSKGLIKTYVVDEREYFCVTGWHHQKIDRPQKPRYPGPLDDHSTNGRDKSTNGRGTFVAGIQNTEGNTERKIPEPNGSGAEAPPRDARTELFGPKLDAIKRMTGKRDDQCRTLLGRWLKTAKDDALAVSGAIDSAERDRVADPISWIEARLRGPPRPLRVEEDPLYRNVL